MCKSDIDELNAILKIIEDNPSYYYSDLLYEKIEKYKEQFEASLDKSQQEIFADMWILIERYFSLIESDAFNDGVLQVLISETEQENPPATRTQAENNS